MAWVDTVIRHKWPDSAKLPPDLSKISGSFSNDDSDGEDDALKWFNVLPSNVATV